MKEGQVKVARSQVAGPKQGKESVHTGVLPGAVSGPEQGEQDLHA